MGMEVEMVTPLICIDLTTTIGLTAFFISGIRGGEANLLRFIGMEKFLGALRQ
jgi:hypothetical protein